MEFNISIDTIRKILLLLSMAILIIFGSRSSAQGAKMSEKESEYAFKNILKYYTEQGIMTDPGKYAYLYEDLPSKISEQCKIVQGVMIHIFWAKSYGVELSEERKKEVQIRKIEDMLGRIKEMDDRSISIAREPDKRVVGNCRDFSVFLCSLLRSKGIPARARCGFATYFTPGRYEDHWICEYWNAQEKRWVRLDAQLDSLQLWVLKIDFDPHDLPQGKFLSGGETWQLCRFGKIDPDLCGIFDMKGLWFVQGNVVRDFMALNRMEVLPWDCNTLMGGRDREVTQDEYELLDRIATLSQTPDAFSEIRNLYDSNPALRMPEDWTP